MKEQYSLGGMALRLSDLPVLVENSSISSNGRALPEVRATLRKIPSFRNTWTVICMYGQNILILAAAVRVDRWFTWLIAFVLMGRMFAQFAALMHDAAHRLLFTHRGANDFVGLWILGYPTLTNTPGYRRVHMVHHREEFGPNEPDIPLYANYPITPSSLRRKLIRDISGQTAFKLLSSQARGFTADNAQTRRATWSMAAVQLLIFAVFFASGHPWLYLTMWVLPYVTLWRVINRLRSIAEHGGLRADKDRRITTHSVRQHWIARFYIVPYGIGFHLAHHADAAVPFRHLARYHALLTSAHYVDATIEYPTYRSLWKALVTPR